MKRILPLLVAAGFGLAAQDAFAQADISLQVAGKKYQASGQGECKAAPQASIYGVLAALYSVSERSGKRSLELALWQPKNGAPAMMSLHVTLDGKRYEVDTVKAGTKTSTKGSGKATLEKSGAGGTVAVDAVTAAGEKIRGRIRCQSFSAIHAEGG